MVSKISLKEAVVVNKNIDPAIALKEQYKTIESSYCASLDAVFVMLASVMNVKHIPESMAADIVRSTGIVDAALDYIENHTVNLSSAASTLASGFAQIFKKDLDSYEIEYQSFVIKFIYSEKTSFKYDATTISQKAGVRTVTEVQDSKYEDCFKKIQRPTLNPSGCETARENGLFDSSDYSAVDKKSIEITVDFK